VSCWSATSRTSTRASSRPARSAGYSATCARFSTTSACTTGRQDWRGTQPTSTVRSRAARRAGCRALSTST
jgi:hypothetical protein